MKPIYLLFIFLFYFKAYAAVPVFQHHSFNGALLNNNIKAITQDHKGFMWIGTTYGLFKFDGHQFKKIPTDSVASVIDVFFLYADDKENIWVSTRNNGLLVYSKGSIQQIDFSKFNVKKTFKITSDHNGKLWVATDQGVFHLSDQLIAQRPFQEPLKRLSKKLIRYINFIDDGRMILSGLNDFYIIDRNNNSVEEYYVNDDESEYIHDITYDLNNKLWIGTTKKLYIFDFLTKSFIDAPTLTNSNRVFSLVLQNKYMWVATIGGGLFKINIQDFNVQQFTHDKSYIYSLSEQYIMSLFISQDNNLWIGGFSKGLNVLHLDSMNFSYDTNVKNSIYCAKSALIHDIDVSKSGINWLSYEYGLIKYDPEKQLCTQVQLSSDETQDITVYSMRKDGDDMWLSTSSGLLKYNNDTHITTDITKGLLKDFAVFFSHEMNSEQLILGTTSGLFVYNFNTASLDKIVHSDENFNNKAFVKFATNSKGELFLPTTSGLLHLNLDLELQELSVKRNPFIDKEIFMVQINTFDEMLVSTNGDGLYYLDKDYKIKNHYVDNEIFSSTNFIYQIQFEENQKIVWMTSEQGLIRLNLEDKNSQLFTGNVQYKYLSQIQSSNQYNGIIYFTGNTGIISFDPKNINFNHKNKRVIFDSFFVIDDSQTSKQSGFNRLSDDEVINFNHNDKLIRLEFVAPDYSGTANINYAYKLEPVFNNWIELPNGDPLLTFTNLKPDQYDLSLKARNIDKSWSNQISRLSFIVNPAPWKTWWAYLIYAMLSLLILYLYIINKIKKEKQLNTYLNTQVKKQTEHIEKQKQKLQQLMTRKDEIFANVTHEFRTPITLIKGPISTLEKNEKNPQHLDLLSMMKRNANRLLTLVNQMLTLSEIVDGTEEKPKLVIAVDKTLKMIAEPYAFNAQKKGIKFYIDDIHQADICVTTDALLLTVGNFLSNAFKYTPKGGKVTLSTSKNHNNISIHVQDSGCGFEEKDIAQIFKRFGRLPQHQNVEGTGIGLALVKEAADLNDAHIEVNSTVGEGSSFSITFPTFIATNSLITENQTTVLTHKEPKIINNNKETVLIIDDNKDMRDYIELSLQDNFHCLVAPNGQLGIALALKNVPDIIVCDVMMPGIDGFHVCRLLREDMITSHIPLILLTALTEKSSRIKGWRENIDMYLNKPFDADELNLQLKNILNIRSILNKKSLTAVNTEINEADLSHLSEIDQKFIDKLTSIIEKNFKNPSLNLKSLSQAMFISERQLQRKTKALINTSPVDYIKEFRLKKAVQILKEGHQISIASDNSGFGSLSSFSQSFKKQYGMTPKEYQKLNKNS